LKEGVSGVEPLLVVVIILIVHILRMLGRVELRKGRGKLVE
jgi:hypothetical protein